MIADLQRWKVSLKHLHKVFGRNFVYAKRRDSSSNSFLKKFMDLKIQIRQMVSSEFISIFLNIKILDTWKQ